MDFSAEENSEGYILKIHERKNSLVRPPIVNIDQAVVIMSVKEPDFNSNLLDRFLVLLEHKGIHPIVYISKMDLLEDRGELDFTSRPMVTSAMTLWPVKRNSCLC